MPERDQQQLQREARARRRATGRSRSRRSRGARCARRARRAARPARRPRRTPSSPSSSPTAASTRSVCAAGTKPGSPRPSPVPGGAARRRAPTARAPPGRRPGPRCRTATATSPPAARPSVGTPRRSPPRNPASSSAKPATTIVMPPSGHAVEREEDARDHQRGPEVLLQEEEHEDQPHAGHDRQHVVEARHVEQPQPRATRRPRLGELPERLPAAGEVAGEEQQDEQPDRLDRLHAEQVHLRVARAGSAAEDDQDGRQQDGAAERHVAESPEG